MALGFAVWLQRRRSTRLRLTQSLNWLAAFAGAVFLLHPVQTEAVSYVASRSENPRSFTPASPAQKAPSA